MERDINIGRREFLTRAVVGGGLIAGGVTGFYFDSKSRVRKHGEAIREVVEQGITPSDPEAVAAARNLSEEIKMNPLADRNPDKIRQAREVLDNQSTFANAVEKARKEKVGVVHNVGSALEVISAIGGIIISSYPKV